MPTQYSTIDGAELPSDYGDIGFFDIDREVFASQYQKLSISELGARSLSTEWYARNPSIYTLLMSAGQVVGYCNTMPVTPECFDALMAGTIKDGEIPADAVCAFHESFALSVYICGFAIRPSHQVSAAAVIALLRGVRIKFQKLRNSGVRIREVGAVAWSEGGRRLADIFGLSPRLRVPELGVVYRGKPNRYFGYPERR
jgi:hypothetical protein